MNSIITFLLNLIQSLFKIIDELLLRIEELSPKAAKKPFDSKSPEYRQLTVDIPPIVIPQEKLDYKVLLKQYLSDTGKSLAPVKQRGKHPVPQTVICPRCGAPHQYIYDNTGGRGQLFCKICLLKFCKELVHNNIKLRCPYCSTPLTMKRTRSQFNVHFCHNPQCPYFLNSRKALTPDQIAEQQQHPERFKLHYYYRESTVDFFKMDPYSMPAGSCNLKFRNFSPHVLGLCLSYTVNLGLSTRVTAMALRDIHEVSISHVTVAKYAKTAAAIVKPFVDSFDYKPSNYIAADETYIKVKKVKHYVWFVMDALKKSILGYQVSDSRGLAPCILAMRMAFDKFKVFPGKALKFIADGFPVYLLARNEFAKNNMDFDVTQVVGLTNDDPVSTEYRWVKQIIERVNRTFKFSYRVTNGYGTFAGSNTHIALFVACYNFLRPHPYNYWRPLNEIPGVSSAPNMPAKWIKLIELSQNYLLMLQTQ
ncbi:MAG: IS6 family transposase [Saccharofermentanales bacterium]